MKHWMRRYKNELLLFLFALVLRQEYLVLSLFDIGSLTHLSITPDTSTYVAGAQSLLNGTADYKYIFLQFGPGYPLFLASIFTLFGVSAVPVLILQVVLSAFSCVLVYTLAKRLTGDKIIATCAGLVLACSITAIELSSILLSDCLFFFLFALALVLGTQGLLQGSKWRLCVSALLFGIAALTRSIIQFWPLMMLPIAFTLRTPPVSHTSSTRPKTRNYFLRLVLLWVGIFILIESAWITRNAILYDVPGLALSSAGAFGTIAAMSVQEPGKEGDYRITMSSWMEEYQQENGITTLQPADRLFVLKERGWEIFKHDPIRFITSYVRISWWNLNDVSYLHRSQLPAIKPDTIAAEGMVRRYKLNYYDVIFSFVGICILVIRRQFRLAILLGCLYVYFAFVIGVYLYQGSRYFHPGQIASSILIAIACVSLYQYLAAFFRKKESVAVR